jgi:KaiC/GvpD/RAD55 family RecA-like ATPase
MTFAFDRLDRDKIYLCLSSAERLRENASSIIRGLHSRGYVVIIVTTNQPYAILKKAYEKDGIDLSRVRFIDAITRYAIGEVPSGVPGARFTSSPSDLTQLGIAISDSLKDMTGKRAAILLDSVSTMLIYLPSPNLSKFIHFVSSKLKILDMAGIFLAVEDGLDPILLSQLTTFVDQVVNMDREPDSSRLPSPPPTPPPSQPPKPPSSAPQPPAQPPSQLPQPPHRQPPAS